MVKALSAYGFYLGYDDVGAMLGYYSIERVAIEHAEYFVLIGHLHGRGVLVGIASDYILS
jgi:hypothetical protein